MKQKGFSERLSAARDAKPAMAAKFRQQPGPDGPSGCGTAGRPGSR
jgi:Family of unknown function (DUF6481)